MKKNDLQKILKNVLSNSDRLKLHHQLGLFAILFGVISTQNAIASQSIFEGSLSSSLTPEEHQILVDLIKQIDQNTPELQREHIYELVSSLSESQRLSLLESIERGEDLNTLISQLLGEDNQGLVLDENGALASSVDSSATKAISSEYGSDSATASAVETAVESSAAPATGVVAMSGFSPLAALGGIVGVAAAAGGGGGGGAISEVVRGLQVLNGQVIDGYLMNANVFVRSADGSLARVGTTDELGRFVGLDNTLGLKLTDAQTELPIVVTGGIDQSTQRPFTGQLEAPAGSSVVTPLTTIIQKLMGMNPALTVFEAETAIQTAFGIVGNVDLTNFDPIEMADSSDPTIKAMALKIYQKSIELVTSAVMADLSSANLNFDDTLKLVVESLAQQINQSLLTTPGSMIDLSNTSTFVNSSLTGLSNILGSSLLGIRDKALLAINQLNSSNTIASVNSIRNLIDREDSAVGSDSTKLLSASVNESELLALDTANQVNRNKMFDGEKFLSIGEISLSVDGTTLADSNLDLVTLSRLGVDEVLFDSDLSGRVDVSLGYDAALNNLSSGITQPSQSQIDAAEDTLDSLVNNAPRFAAAARVNLGLTSNEMLNFIDELESMLASSNGAIDTSGPLVVLRNKGVDSIAFSSVASGSRGDVVLSEDLADALASLDFSFADYFNLKENDSASQVQTHLVVEGTTLVDFDLSDQDLSLLGVDEIRFGELFEGDVGFFDSLGEAVQFASGKNFDARFGSSIDIGLKVTLDQSTLDAIESLLSPPISRMAALSVEDPAVMLMSSVEPTILNSVTSTSTRDLNGLALDFEPLIEAGVDHLIVGVDGQSAQQLIDLSDLEGIFSQQSST